MSSMFSQMNKSNYFIGVSLANNSAISRAVSPLISQHSAAIRWQLPEKWHLTTVFFAGSYPSDLTSQSFIDVGIPTLSVQGQKIYHRKNQGILTINCASIEMFFWHRRICNILKIIPAAFDPHITIARGPFEQISAIRLPNINSQFHFNELILFESARDNQQLYRKIHTFRLEK